jgi:hypothetical protein
MSIASQIRKKFDKKEKLILRFDSDNLNHFLFWTRTGTKRPCFMSVRQKMKRSFKLTSSHQGHPNTKVIHFLLKTKWFTNETYYFSCFEHELDLLLQTVKNKNCYWNEKKLIKNDDFAIFWEENFFVGICFRHIFAISCQMDFFSFVRQQQHINFREKVLFGQLIYHFGHLVTAPLNFFLIFTRINCTLLWHI